MRKIYKWQYSIREYFYDLYVRGLSKHDANIKSHNEKTE